MRIQNNSSLHFQGKFIADSKITRLQPIKERVSTSFVELLPTQGDIKLLEELDKIWEYNKFVTNLKFTLNKIRQTKTNHENNHIYVMTLQQDNFDKLIPEQILGITEPQILPDGSLNLLHIEANPNIIYSLNPEYEDIGTSILDVLKTQTHKIYTKSEPGSTVNFYYKNDFKHEEGKSKLNLYWEA